MIQIKYSKIILMVLLFVCYFHAAVVSAEVDIFKIIEGAEIAERENLRRRQAAGQMRDLQVNNMQKIILLANKGHPDAQCELGVMFDTGRGVPEDDAKALYWFRKAADQGHALAQNNLGVMYYYGQGVRKDYAKALYWYQKSADQGNALAQNNIGELYEKGQGVPKDNTKASYWYQKSANQGYAEAQKALKKIR